MELMSYFNSWGVGLNTKWGHKHDIAQIAQQYRIKNKAAIALQYKLNDKLVAALLYILFSSLI